MVRDNGMGISKDSIKKLYREKNSLVEHKQVNRQGTGLGLHVCKATVFGMGGSIKVESKTNYGTQTTITLLSLALVDNQEEMEG